MTTLARPLHPHMISRTAPPKKKWTERELISLPKDDGKYELVDGELVLMSPATFNHGEVSVRISTFMGMYVLQNSLGSVLDGQTGFWMKSGNLRSPDISFVSKATFNALERLPTGFFRGGPDLAVEVVSPSDRTAHIKGKIADYFASGTKLVWVVRPKTESARIYRSPGRSVLLSSLDCLDGGEILPGFKLPIRAIFDKQLCQ